MALTTIELEAQIAILDVLIVEYRNRARGSHPGDRDYLRYEVLKAVATDLRARLQKPRSLSLGDLDRAIRKMQASKTGLGYDERKMVHVASTLVQHWPFVRQALESYGEASAE